MDPNIVRFLGAELRTKHILLAMELLDCDLHATLRRDTTGNYKWEKRRAYHIFWHFGEASRQYYRATGFDRGYAIGSCVCQSLHAGVAISDILTLVLNFLFGRSSVSAFANTLSLCTLPCEMRAQHSILLNRSKGDRYLKKR